MIEAGFLYCVQANTRGGITTKKTKSEKNSCMLLFAKHTTSNGLQSCIKFVQIEFLSLHSVSFLGQLERTVCLVLLRFNHVLLLGNECNSWPMQFSPAERNHCVGTNDFSAVRF